MESSYDKFGNAPPFTREDNPSTVDFAHEVAIYTALSLSPVLVLKVQARCTTIT